MSYKIDENAKVPAECSKCGSKFEIRFGDMKPGNPPKCPDCGLELRFKEDIPKLLEDELKKFFKKIK